MKLPGFWLKVCRDSAEIFTKMSSDKELVTLQWLFNHTLQWAVIGQLLQLFNQGWCTVKEIQRDGQFGGDGETGCRLRCHGTLLPSGEVLKIT